MTFIRHPKGNGRKFDESEACQNSEIYRSELHGETNVFNSVIRRSTVIDAFIHGANISDSAVRGTIVSGGTIEESEIACASVCGNVTISNSWCFGETKISGSAEVHNSKINNLVVGGNAVLNFNNDEVFNGCFGRVLSGIWTKPPRVHRFDDLEITITESTGQKAFVGCIEKSIADWHKYGYRYGKARGWTNEQVKAVLDIFDSWL